jgi:hypothetical protein
VGIAVFVVVAIGACADAGSGSRPATGDDYILDVDRGKPPTGALRAVEEEFGGGGTGDLDIVASATIDRSAFMVATVADGILIVNVKQQPDGSWTTSPTAPLPKDRVPPVPRGSGGANLDFSIGAPYGQIAGYVDPEADLVRCVNAIRDPLDGSVPEDGLAQVVTTAWCVVEVFDGEDLLYAHPVGGPEPAGAEIGALDPHAPGEAELEVARAFVEAVEGGDTEAAIELVDPSQSPILTVPPLVALLEDEQLEAAGDPQPFPLGYTFSLSERDLQLGVVLVKLEAGYRVWDWVVGVSE